MRMRRSAEDRAATAPASRRRRPIVLAFLAGACSVVLLLTFTALAIRWLDSSGRLPERSATSDAELSASLDAELARSAEENRSDIAHHVRTLHERQQRDPNATLDFLLLSGGGDRGAFGAGFLLGWTTVPPGETAMPRFDGVSGVSAGSFIAPFAFLGTESDFETIDRLFRAPKPDWVQRRGLLFFLPGYPSLASVPGLERDLRAQIDLPFAERIVRASAGGTRVLLIQATDMDDGTGRVFDAVAAARKAVETGDPRLLSDLLLASSAIPGAFPPRQIAGRLYADGGIASNFFYGGSMPLRDTFGATWRREHPDAPIPRTRYWVIINEYIQPLPVTVQPTWPAIVERSIYVSVRSAEAIALRHLYALAEATRLRGDGEVEVRWVAVPEAWKPPTDTPFDGDTMRSLADAGQRLGADPAAWQTSAP